MSAVGPMECSGARDHKRVYGQLKPAMINYRFRPGEQIMVTHVAERLIVSSTQVRETLIRLQGEVLLDAAPHRGFFAKTLSIGEMSDLFQLRFSILRFAVERLVELPEKSFVPNLLPLRTATNGNEFQPDPARHPECLEPEFVADRASKLCEALTGCTGNETMVRVLRNANERTHYIRTIDFETPARADEMTENIESVLTNLERNDFGGAIAILRRDLDRQISLLPSLVKEGISRACLRPSWTHASLPRQRPPLVAARGSAARR